MKETKIKLTSMDEAKAFVQAAMKCDFDVGVYLSLIHI